MSIFIKNDLMSKNTRRLGGRPPIDDPATNCCKVRFNAKEYAKFLDMYELSGAYSKASFIKSRVFDETFRVIKVDRTLLDYYQKLSALYAQYRAIGVNYNQIVVALKMNFTEKKALAMLYKLEAETLKLVALMREVLVLTEEFEKRWSQK